MMSIFFILLILALNTYLLFFAKANEKPILNLFYMFYIAFLIIAFDKSQILFFKFHPDSILSVLLFFSACLLFIRYIFFYFKLIISRK